MQNTTIRENFMYAPSIEIEKLDNLFFELTRENCNLKCKNCYIKRTNYKEVKDYLKIDKIKNSLLAVKNDVKAIYLTGGEPMIHPEFNKILRMCLKFADTTIMTNGTFLNEKKARFFRKIDDENNYEIVFVISMGDWREKENDEIRGYGNYRRTMLGINSLLKYEFNPIISYVNTNNLREEEIFNNFREVFERIGFEFEKINLKIMPDFNNTKEIEANIKIKKPNYDCTNSRIVSARGVFACPILCNDFRSRVGSTIDDCSNKVCLDTEKCSICALHNRKIFSHNWIS